MDDEQLDAEQKRDILRQVAAYRDLCDQVRRGSGGSLLFGGLMFFIWWATIPDQEKFAGFGLLYFGLACLEFGTGLYNRFFPSAEGVLLDGIVLIVFGMTNLVRQYLRWAAGGSVLWIFAFFSAYWIYTGFNHVVGYRTLRRLFTHRPTKAHLRWFNELLHEVQTGDPEADPDALDLPTSPRLRAKLLGDTAIVLLGRAEVVIVAREFFQLLDVRTEPGDDRKRAHVALGGFDMGECWVSPENWKNYSKWKATGEPPVVLPSR